MIVEFFETSIGKKLLSAITFVVSKVRWPQWYPLQEDELTKVKALLKDNYYIILTRHGNHLSTVAINIAHKTLTGNRGYYGHVLMNLEDTVKTDDDYRLVEAIGPGSQFSTFDEVFGTSDSVALLKPVGLKIEEWTAILDKAKTLTGRKYDTVYDMYDDSKLSCVELVRSALLADKKYVQNFGHLEAMLRQYNRLDPQMYYESPDFEVVYEVRRGWFSTGGKK
jgi:hypothetical protein